MALYHESVWELGRWILTAGLRLDYEGGTMDVTIPAIPVTVSSTGISFSGTDIIPTAMGGPYEKYKVTNLSGSIVNGTINLSLNFGSYPTRYTGTSAQ